MTKTTSTRLFSLAVLGAAALPAFAQTAPSQADIERMMKGMQAMQQCMSGLDESALERLERRGNSIEAEVNKLCAAGKRDEAQRKAMAFATEFRNDPTAARMLGCTEQMRDMMPPMPYASWGDEGDDAQGHVCDD